MFCITTSFKEYINYKTREKTVEERSRGDKDEFRKRIEDRRRDFRKQLQLGAEEEGKSSHSQK